MYKIMDSLNTNIKTVFSTVLSVPEGTIGYSIQFRVKYQIVKTMFTPHDDCIIGEFFDFNNAMTHLIRILETNKKCNSISLLDNCYIPVESKAISSDFNSELIVLPFFKTKTFTEAGVGPAFIIRTSVNKVQVFSSNNLPYFLLPSSLYEWCSSLKTDYDLLIEPAGSNQYLLLGATLTCSEKPNLLQFNQQTNLANTLLKLFPSINIRQPVKAVIPYSYCFYSPIALQFTNDELLQKREIFIPGTTRIFKTNFENLLVPNIHNKENIINKNIHPLIKSYIPLVGQSELSINTSNTRTVVRWLS